MTTATQLSTRTTDHKTHKYWPQLVTTTTWLLTTTTDHNYRPQSFNYRQNPTKSDNNHTTTGNNELTTDHKEWPETHDYWQHNYWPQLFTSTIKILSRLPPKSVPLLVRAVFGGIRHQPSSHHWSIFHFPLVLSCLPSHLVRWGVSLNSAQSGDYGDAILCVDFRMPFWWWSRSV